MLFGIAGYTDTEIGFKGMLHFIIQEFPVVHCGNLAHQFIRMGMAIPFRDKTPQGFGNIPPQCQNIINTQVMKIDQGIFRIFF